MKQCARTMFVILAVLSVSLCLPAAGWAKPVDSKTALHVSQVWLAANPAPMVRNSAGKVWKTKGIRPFRNPSGEILAYVVDLKPRGFIVVPADDEVEPILAFGTEGDFTMGTGSEGEQALSDLLMWDISNRLRDSDKTSQEYKHKIAERWAKARNANLPTDTKADATRNVSLAEVTLVVGPLLTTLWSQGPDYAPYTYNYCVPNHYVTGCTATAMGMIIYYHRFPASAACTNTIYLQGVATTASFNDTFNYDLMPTQLTSATPLASIQEVSKLLYDCGITVGMKYNTAYNGGSGGAMTKVPDALKSVFHYPSANWKSGQDYDWNEVLRTEMVSGYPVEMEIWDLRNPSMPIGHVVVCDGWGTEDGLDRYHLNFGWSGDSNAWYAVPGMETGRRVWETLKGIVWNIRSTDDVPPDAPTFAPDGGAISGPVNLAIACASPGAVIHYTTNGLDPTTDDPIVAGPILVDRNMTVKARAWGREPIPPGPVKSAEYTIAPLAGIKGLANSTTVDLPASVITAVPSSGRFYVEATDRSSGIMVYKSGYAATPGRMVRVQGTVGTAANGERWISATSITDAGSGSIEPLTLTSRDIGGGDWLYDAATGTGQKGMKDWVRNSRSTYSQGLNNIGLLITLSGTVTYSTSGYFYVDDGWGIVDNSGRKGVKVLGAVPQPSPLPPDWTPVGRFMRVTGISSCFKAPSPSTDLFRQIIATQVVLIQ